VADELDATVVEREETPVMCLRAGGLDRIGATWERLEAAVGSPGGRRFSGAMEVPAMEYRACVELQEGDDPAALGLEVAVLPGGAYLRTRLHGEPPGVHQEIAPIFERLVTLAGHDPTRPSLEHYRRRDEIDLFLPIAPP